MTPTLDPVAVPAQADRRGRRDAALAQLAGLRSARRGSGRTLRAERRTSLHLRTVRGA